MLSLKPQVFIKVGLKSKTFILKNENSASKFIMSSTHSLWGKNHNPIKFIVGSWTYSKNQDIWYAYVGYTLIQSTKKMKQMCKGLRY